MDSKIGLIVTVNRLSAKTNCFGSKTVTTMCRTMQEAKDELVTYLCEQFKHINIDFPTDLEEFEFLWFHRNAVECNAFTYRVFNGRWEQPWECDDIYCDVVDRMFDQDTKNPPDFSELYGEPNPDEIKEDSFAMQPEQTDELKEIESKLEEILRNTTENESHLNTMNQTDSKDITEKSLDV